MTTVQIIAIATFLLTPWFLLNILYPFKSLGIQSRKVAFILTCISIGAFLWASIKYSEERPANTSPVAKKQESTEGQPRVEVKENISVASKPVKNEIDFDGKSKIVNFYQNSRSLDSFNSILEEDILSKNKPLHHGALKDIADKLQGEEAVCRADGLYEILGSDRIRTLIPATSHGRTDFEYPQQLAQTDAQKLKIEELFARCKAEFLVHIEVLANEKKNQLVAEAQQKTQQLTAQKQAEEDKRNAEWAERQRADDEKRKLAQDETDKQALKDKAASMAGATLRAIFKNECSWDGQKIPCVNPSSW